MVGTASPRASFIPRGVPLGASLPGAGAPGWAASCQLAPSAGSFPLCRHDPPDLSWILSCQHLTGKWESRGHAGTVLCLPAMPSPIPAARGGGPGSGDPQQRALRWPRPEHRLPEGGGGLETGGLEHVYGI